tara:strand:+ start:172 stop:531 length:360 start_codon:yes stop_codon:yes gene_type:complete
VLELQTRRGLEQVPENSDEAYALLRASTNPEDEGNIDEYTEKDFNYFKSQVDPAFQQLISKYPLPWSNIPNSGLEDLAKTIHQTEKEVDQGFEHEFLDLLIDKCKTPFQITACAVYRAN